MRRLLLALIGCLSVLPLSAAAPAHTPAPARTSERPLVRIGVIATRDYIAPEYTWGPTLHQLTRALPAYRFMLVTLNGQDYRRAVRDRDVDFVIGNPAQYVELEAAYGASRIATVEFAGGPSPSLALGSAVIVKAGRKDIRTLNDVRGHSMAAISPELFGGFRLAWREFALRGIDPFTDTSALTFTGDPVGRVFAAVRDGKVDVGIVRSCLLERLAAAGRFRQSEFIVIEGRRPRGMRCLVSTPLYPDWPFAKLAHTPNALAKQVALALLAMPPGSNGQSWTIPVDYQPVADVFRTLKIGPYAYLRQRSWQQILRANWHWLALVGLCLIWMAISLARVQYLVRLRTQQLSDANVQARREREKMEHAARLSLMGEMASSLAHEISQPLAAIVNYARGCQRRIADRLPVAEIEPGVNQIVVQAERAATILRRMRDFVRKRPPTPAEFNAGEILSETLELFAPLAERRGAVLEYDAADPLPRIRADRIQIEEVLLNLLQNAVDAVEGCPERRIRLSASVQDGILTVAVCDTGPGISEKARERLFEAFFTTKPQGLGLGLSLSRSIIEAHGGRLSGENRPEGGAVLSFSLPIIEGDTYAG